MQKTRNVLPPLDYLLAFEAAAKNQSFAAASRELNISESAISRKAKLLELHYGVALFVRGHKSVSLTAQGNSLLEMVQPAMQSLRDVSADLITRKNHNEVTLAATNSVAALWLLPRLRKFNARNKQLNIMLVASDNDAECLGDNIDLSILRGDGNWPGYNSRMLFGETVFPVCSPAFQGRYQQSDTLKNLADLSLVDVSSGHPEWMNWETWLRAKLTKPPIIKKSIVFNTYPLAVQAAVDGLGIALGWGHLVDHLLDSGALVRPLRQISTRTEYGYYLLRREKKKSFPERNAVEDWLLKESAALKTYATRT